MLRVSLCGSLKVTGSSADTDLGAALTIVLWEHLITFNKEVELIWLQPLGLTKIIFIFNRYVVDVGLIYSAYGTSPFPACARNLIGGIAISHVWPETG